MKIPSGHYEAYLFDCDGTIADSMPLHYLAWKKALSIHNCFFSEEQFYALAGMPIDTIINKLNQEQGLQMNVAQVRDQRENAYFELLPQIKSIPQVEEQIRSMFGKIPLAVVSGSPRDSVLKTLNYLKLTPFFQTIVGAEDYQKGKPDPEPFLTAALRLGVPANKCLVFEDADLGIQSAVAAGMNWVKVP